MRGDDSFREEELVSEEDQSPDQAQKENQRASNSRSPFKTFKVIHDDGEDLGFFRRAVKFVCNPSTICCQAILMKICDSQWFVIVYNLCIVANTLCLGLDSYPSDLNLAAQLDIVNVMFFSLFFIEMLIKTGGMGPQRYIKDHFNIFDALIGKILMRLTSLYSDPEHSGCESELRD
jgi:Ion transport protein